MDKIQRERDYQKLKNIYALAKEDNKNLRAEITKIVSKAKIREIQLQLLLEFIENVNRRYMGFTKLVQILGVFLDQKTAKNEIPHEIQETINFMRKQGLIDE
jgi:Ca2+-binding EF-hand superfamily protein